MEIILREKEVAEYIRQARGRLVVRLGNG